ncbi:MULTISPECIES: hypothetical protein, partial [unclassified Paraburkholderia]|uniref:hypothetical protein n=1 Tax=unclassified Paraburkholderia TaxID=2615204 RepID=UPI002AB28ECA
VTRGQAVKAVQLGAPFPLEKTDGVQQKRRDGMPLDERQIDLPLKKGVEHLKPREAMRKR